MHRELMINDVSRAYFYAPATRSLFIELPDEDDEAQEGEVGRLNVCLHGTRDAARARPRSECKVSTVHWSPVNEWTVVINPFSIPTNLFRISATGARQLVVQEAFETTV